MYNTDATIATLKFLKLYGMANTIADLAEQSSLKFEQAQPILDDLLKAEVAECEVRSINYLTMVAKFPA